MDTTPKLKPLNTDIIFCEHPSAHKNVQCAFCARNIKRYDLTSRAFYSVFAGPRKDARRKCEHYISDYRQPKDQEQ